jgi:hypothetical protein
MVRLAPEQSRDWARAMLAELEFIKGDWAALFWALGSVAAVLRHASQSWRKWIAGRKVREEGRMNSTGKKAIGVVSGAGLALVLVFSAFGLLRLAHYLFPGLGLDRLEWTHWLTVIVIPEAVFVVAAILLWRKRAAVAAGILLTGAVIALHVVMHYATR